MPYTGFDADLEAPAATPSIAQLMAFLVRQQTQMAEMMIAFKSGGREHMANANVDDRNFRRIEKFTNKREAWKEWKMHFSSCVRGCDTSFADFLWGLEKRQDEIDLLSLDPAQSQLTAALYSRLISVTTGEAFRNFWMPFSIILVPSRPPNSATLEIR